MRTRVLDARSCCHLLSLSLSSVRTMIHLKKFQKLVSVDFSIAKLPSHPSGVRFHNKVSVTLITRLNLLELNTSVLTPDLHNMGYMNDQTEMVEQYNMGGLLQFSVANAMILAMKSLSLCISVCVFSIKTTFIVIQTWMELAKAAVLLHMHMFWKVSTWIIALIFLPKRILTALRRERLLEQNVKEMQFEVESLLWHMKKLEDHLENVTKECNLMKIMLVELEEEYESEVCKVEEVQQKLVDARHENLQMKKTRGKTKWSSKADDRAESGIAVSKNGDFSKTESSKSSSEVGGASSQDLMSQGGSSKSEPEGLHMLEAGTSTELIYPSMPVTREDLPVGDIISRQRVVSIVRSIFSATLSLLFAMVIWEAENPGISLMLALFTVVVISLASASKVVSALEYRPAYEAVALVTLNTFILGILSYPTLPKLVHAVLHQ